MIVSGLLNHKWGAFLSPLMFSFSILLFLLSDSFLFFFQFFLPLPFHLALSLWLCCSSSLLGLFLSSLSLLRSVELASIVAVFSCYCQCCDRNSVHWLYLTSIYINLHLLPWTVRRSGGDVRGQCCTYWRSLSHAFDHHCHWNHSNFVLWSGFLISLGLRFFSSTCLVYIVRSKISVSFLSGTLSFLFSLT